MYEIVDSMSTHMYVSWLYDSMYEAVDSVNEHDND